MILPSTRHNQVSTNRANTRERVADRSNPEEGVYLIALVVIECLKIDKNQQSIACSTKIGWSAHSATLGGGMGQPDITYRRPARDRFPSRACGIHRPFRSCHQRWPNH